MEVRAQGSSSGYQSISERRAALPHPVRKGSAFPVGSLICFEALPPSPLLRRSLIELITIIGKAKPFRTGCGRAGKL